MNKINVVELNNANFQVTVIDVDTTKHEVTVQPSYALKLTNGKVSNEELVRKSFEFLLARESNTSILRSFDLSVIERYFPEFEGIISE